MKRRTNTSQNNTPLPILLLLIGAFILGSASGSLLAAKDEKTAALLVDALLGGQSGHALRMIVFDLTLLLMVFAAGFMKKGAFLCMGAFLLKGLLLSLSVTSCIGALGGPGWGAAFALGFGSGFLAVAALLLLSLQALQCDGKRLPGGRKRRDNVYYLTLLLCSGIMGLSELIYWYLAPPLARAAVALFT